MLPGDGIVLAILPSARFLWFSQRNFSDFVATFTAFFLDLTMKDKTEREFFLQSLWSSTAGSNSLPSGLSRSLSDAPSLALLTFLISGPDFGAWPDCLVSVEFFRVPIPRKESDSTTNQVGTILYGRVISFDRILIV